MISKGKLILLSVLGLAALLTVGGFWYWQSKKTAAPQPEATPGLFGELSPVEAGDTLGGQILGKIQNPFKGEFPTVNPFAKTETNPLGGIYVNPFE